MDMSHAFLHLPFNIFHFTFAQKALVTNNFPLLVFGG